MIVSRLGQYPSDCDRKIGARGHPGQRCRPITSASCSARIALPSIATDVTIRSTTAIERNVLSGTRRPSRKMAQATTASTDDARSSDPAAT